MPELSAFLRRDLSGVHVGGELFDTGVRVLDVRPQLRCWRELGIAQPVMADHPLLVWIRDRARLQLAHVQIRLFDARSHFLKKFIREPHPADVGGKIEIVVAKEIFLETRPERRRSHADRSNRGPGSIGTLCFVTHLKLISPLHVRRRDFQAAWFRGVRSVLGGPLSSRVQHR